MALWNRVCPQCTYSHRGRHLTINYNSRGDLIWECMLLYRHTPWESTSKFVVRQALSVNRGRQLTIKMRSTIIILLLFLRPSLPTILCGRPFLSYTPTVCSVSHLFTTQIAIFVVLSIFGLYYRYIFFQFFTSFLSYIYFYR